MSILYEGPKTEHNIQGAAFTFSQRLEIYTLQLNGLS